MLVLLLPAIALAASGGFVEGGVNRLTEATPKAFAHDAPGPTVVAGYQVLDGDEALIGWHVGLGITQVNTSQYPIYRWYPVGLLEALGGREQHGWYWLVGFGTELALLTPHACVSLQSGVRVHRGDVSFVVGPFGRATVAPFPVDDGRFPSAWQWTAGLTFSVNGDE